MIDHLDVPRFDGPALCAETDPEAFYPDKGGTTKPAKALCGRCEVLDQCREWALDREERYGVWGGLSERERRAELRRRGARPSKAERTATEVRRMVARSMPAEKIAAHLEVSVETVYRVTRPARTPRKWTTPEAKEAVRTLTAHGMSAAEIAKELGISSRTVVRVRSAA